MEKSKSRVVIDDPLNVTLAYQQEGRRVVLELPPLGPAVFDAPLPRVHQDPPPLTEAQRDAKRATRKAERQRRKAGRRGGR